MVTRDQENERLLGSGRRRPQPGREKGPLVETPSQPVVILQGGNYIPFVIPITCLVYINITYQGTRGHRMLWLSFLQISLLWHRAGWTRVGGNLEKQRKGIQPNVQNSTCEDVCRRDFLGLIFIERVV